MWTQGSNRKILSVSKLCCPICWQLLSILRGSSEDLAVRGGHPDLYPVEMPQWLPKDIMLKILAYVDQLLVDQVIIMMMNEANTTSKRHNRKFSGQSPNVSDNDGHRSSFESLYSEDESD